MIRDVPEKHHEVIWCIQEIKNLGLLSDQVKNAERKKIVDGYLEKTEEEEVVFHLKKKQPFVNFKLSFEKMHSVPYSQFIKEFMFLFIHEILPLQDRVSRLTQDEGPKCKLCDEIVIHGLKYEFFNCKYNKGIIDKCFSALRDRRVI